MMVRLQKISVRMKRRILGGRFQQQQQPRRPSSRASPSSSSSGVSDEASCAAIQHIYCDCRRNERRRLKEEEKWRTKIERDNMWFVQWKALINGCLPLPPLCYRCPHTYTPRHTEPHKDTHLLLPSLSERWISVGGWKEMEPSLRWGNELTTILNHLPPPLPPLSSFAIYPVYFRASLALW